MPRYSAYGSNLNRKWRTDRLDATELVGTAVLADHKLRFNKRSRKDGSGKANIVAVPGEQVEGGVFLVTDEQLKLLG